WPGPTRRWRPPPRSPPTSSRSPSSWTAKPSAAATWSSRSWTHGVLAPAGLAADAVIPVWVDAAGPRAGPPAQPAQHDSRALADGMVAVLILAELLWGAGLAACGVADRRRLAAWDAEWRAIGPKWGGHA